MSLRAGCKESKCRTARRLTLPQLPHCMVQLPRPSARCVTPDPFASRLTAVHTRAAGAQDGPHLQGRELNLVLTPGHQPPLTLRYAGGGLPQQKTWLLPRPPGRDCASARRLLLLRQACARFGTLRAYSCTHVCCLSLVYSHTLHTHTLLTRYQHKHTHSHCHHAPDREQQRETGRQAKGDSTRQLQHALML